ncbi:MAG: hypothetical protein E6L04_10190 [Thaumarchaeota archaeon]|nr:MAG: hypothetical protein E6L04_10190 [Nitrososphaerota archaeon]TLX90020.1 MAG: hypothetical protein E6K97_04255 [Nitrososphaerota archaeon]
MKKKIASTNTPHAKFNLFINWFIESLDRIDRDMKDISDIHDLNNISNEISNRRVCMDNGRIFAPTLEEIEKNNYRLIENVPISEWNLDIDDSDIPKRQRKGMKDIAILLASYNCKLGNKEIQ